MPTSLRGVANAVADFLRRPVLPDRASGFSAAALMGVWRLYIIDILLMACLALLGGIALLLGAEFPQNTLEQFALTPGWIAVIVIGAPLTEELLFRSWLSGRIGHIVAGLLAGGVVLLLPLLFASSGGAQIGIGAAIFLMAALGLAALRKWRGRKPIGWFAMIFPVLFWLVALAFGLVHMINYNDATLLAVLPLVIPQFLAGTLFGYARVTYGLWAAMLLHAMHNGSAVVLMLLAGEAAAKSAGAS